jgi:hypothetical protein
VRLVKSDSDLPFLLGAKMPTDGAPLRAVGAKQGGAPHTEGLVRLQWSAVEPTEDPRINQTPSRMFRHSGCDWPFLAKTTRNTTE